MKISRFDVAAVIGIITILGLIAYVGLSGLSDIGAIVGVIGVIAGTLIGYFIEKAAQKRTWKREYVVKLVENVYGYLCNDAKWVIWHLENDKPFPHALNFETWGKRIQEDYRYYMVDKDFRNEVDAFFEKVRGYNNTIIEFHQTLRRIVKEELATKLSRPIDLETEIRPIFCFKNGGSYTRNEVVTYLFNYENPKEAIFSGVPKNDIQELNLQLGQVDAGSVDMDRFIEFLESCVKRREEPYQSILRGKEEILEDAKKLKRKLESRIQEPWNI